MKEKIKGKLISNLGYSEASASRTADDLYNVKHPDLRKALSDWLQGDANTQVTIDSFSTTILMDKYHMTYPAALIFLDWYCENPKEAVSVLGMRM